MLSQLGAVHHRQVVSRHAAGEDLRPELRVRGAAGVKEQARVVGVPARLGVEAEVLAKPGGEDRGLQTVLERQAHAEVGRQAEGADHLSGPYAFRHYRDPNF